MEGFGLLLGHLIGDYVFQTDWQAANKTNPWPGIDPWKLAKLNPFDFMSGTSGERQVVGKTWEKWRAIMSAWWIGHIACTIHCFLYTLAIAIFSFWWMPWWGYVVCFAAHWPVDRWRLARVFMRWTWHEAFATGPLSPWSIILTDNIVHLVVLFALLALKGIP